MRFSIIHALDPADTQAHELLRLRDALRQAETRLLESHHPESRVGPEERARLQGFVKGLLPWLRFAHSLPVWEMSLALEARDRLWQWGHPLRLEDSWGRAAGELLDYLGTDLAPGTSALFLGGTGRGWPGEDPSNYLARVLRAIADRPEIVRILTSPSPTDRVTVETASGIEECPAGDLWRIGDPALIRLRRQALTYIRESQEHNREWSPADPEASSFSNYMRAWAGRQGDLWAPHGESPLSSAR